MGHGERVIGLGRAGRKGGENGLGRFEFGLGKREGKEAGLGR